MTYTEKILDITTGKETIRNLTDEEIAVVDARKAKIQAEQAERDAEQASKDAARQAVLDKLGLSADEITALLG